MPRYKESIRSLHIVPNGNYANDEININDLHDFKLNFILHRTIFSNFELKQSLGSRQGLFGEDLTSDKQTQIEK